MVSAMKTLIPGAEQRLIDLNIVLPTPPRPLGAYVPAVQAGNLVFLSGMLPIADGVPKFTGRVGVELDLEQGRAAAYAACLNALAIIRSHLGSLDRVERVVKLGVSIATTADFVDHPKLADAASNLLESIFGSERTSTRQITGVVCLALGMPVALELVFEIAP